jgi:hypothetical protein
VGKVAHYGPSDAAFPLHTARIARRRNLLALCAALFDTRAAGADSVFPGQRD